MTKMTKIGKNVKDLNDSHKSCESNKSNSKVSHNSHNPSNFKDRDSTATRILLIIRALCNGASLDSLSLKDFDFNISKRTFQRDIKKIKDFFVENIAYIPMQNIHSQNIHSQHIATANLTANPSINPNTNPNKITKTLKGGGNCDYKNAKNALDSVESFDSKDSFDSLDSHNHSNESTHPLTPSAREGECVDLHESTTLSLRGARSETSATKQSKNLISFNDNKGVDCFDFDKSKSRNDKKSVVSHNPTPNSSLTHYIKKFATISGIKSLYPKLDDYFIAELFDDNLNQIYDISHFNFEKINYEIFSQISQSILNHNVISFDYISKNQIKNHTNQLKENHHQITQHQTKNRIVKPYKLFHIKGIWYVIADESGILKNFALNKLQNLEILNKRFYPKTAFLAKISQTHNLWHSQSTKTAIIRIDIKAKHYLLRKSLPPNINLIGYDESKILIRFSYAFDDEIFNFLKLWIPYATIQSPKELQEKFNEKLKDYINATNTDAGSR